MVSGPDASNSCLPGGHPVLISVPPVPSGVRGERCALTGCSVGRLNAGNQPCLIYASQKLVVCRNLALGNDSDNNKAAPLLPHVNQLPVLVYRGHAATVTAVSVSPSGAYAATGDERGHYRVWALDHGDHLCKYEMPTCLTGPVRDIDWDGESRRVCLVGERAGSDVSGACAKALQWDTGVTTGTMGLHLKGRAASCSFKKQRPMRIVTAGKDDSKVLLHSGPPFQKVAVADGVPCNTAHSKGAVPCVRYNAAGTLVVSVGADRCIAVYDGKTLALKYQEKAAHDATIYSVAWSGDDETILTASGDGTCKLWSISDTELKELRIYKPAEFQLGALFDKVPVGGGQTGCAFLQGKVPVSVGLNGQISIFQEDSISVVTGHYAPISATAIDWKNGVFYTGDTDGILCQWDLKTVAPKQRIIPAEGNGDLMYIVHTGAVSGLAVCKGNLLSTGWDDMMRVSSMKGQEQMNPSSLGAQPTAIATGTKVACIATVNGLIVVSDGTVGSLISIPYEASAVAVAKNDETVYVGGKDCKIYVYTVSSTDLTLKHCIENGHLKPIHALRLSNGGQKLASADEKDICVWNLWDYSPLVARGKWCFHVQRVTSLSWSPDDMIIASGSADDSIYLWHIEKKMRRVHYPFSHRGGIVSVDFMKDSLKLLTVGVDSVVNLWDAEADLKKKFDYEMKDIIV